MTADLDNLREQAQNLQACLDRMRKNIDSFPDIREAMWLEMLMQSTLRTLENHIRELEKLQFRPSQQNIIFRK